VVVASTYRLRHDVCSLFLLPPNRSNPNSATDFTALPSNTSSQQTLLPLASQWNEPAEPTQPGGTAAAVALCEGSELQFLQGSCQLHLTDQQATPKQPDTNNYKYTAYWIS